MVTKSTAYLWDTMPFLYLLHFDEPRHHARHYLGSSARLFQRLEHHANGTAARLTEALWEDDQDWVLAGLWLPRDPHKLRMAERAAKRRKNAPKYCRLCGGDKNPPGTIDYPTPYIRAWLMRHGIPLAPPRITRRSQ